MIKVNLSGRQKKTAAKAPGVAKPARRPSNMMPLLHLVVVVGTAVAGYLWHSDLTSQSAQLSIRIGALQDEEKKLDGIIKQLKTYETRKIALEKRVQLIEDLRKNQLSPVVVLDALDDAIDRTRYVWLSNLSQNNTTISVAGVVTSVETLSDFVANLKSTGYFRDINLARFDDARGNYTFTLTCEFSPPSLRVAEKGAN
jgi:type IV pilus assembly protein PilN